MTLTGARPDKAFWLTALRQEAATLRLAAVTDGALDATVPSCPDWTVADLLRHTGVGCRWLATHLVRGVATEPDEGRPELPDDAALLPWWDESLAACLTALDRTDTDLPAWNWAPQPKVAGFWHRRWAHEMAVHRWDAQVAVGLPEPIDTALAVDGVVEVLDSWLPSNPVREHGDDGVIQLIADDTEESWQIRVRGDGLSLLDTATLLPEERDIDVRATGSASDVELAVYGRVPFDILKVDGRESLLDALRVG
ncbi:MAG: maleylpyruvate isomerase family mycothiol-dependent enzyme [Actinocatenispora sp.]